MAKQKLAPYRAKRDFKKTREPSGEKPVKPADYPRFVIQKHAATRLHYDLTPRTGRGLQVLGGNQKAFARSARQAPSRGGRGSPARLRRLRRHDTQRRVWRRHRHAVGPGLLDCRKERTMPNDALRKGELKFMLAGEKLQGSWVLVRMRHDRERRQAQQLAPDQAPRRLRARRRGS